VNTKGQENYDSMETIDDNDKHYLGHLSGICGFWSEQTPVKPKNISSARFFLTTIIPLHFFLYRYILDMCYNMYPGLNDVVSLEDKKMKCLRPPQLGHNDPAGSFILSL